MCASGLEARATFAMACGRAFFHEEPTCVLFLSYEQGRSLSHQALAMSSIFVLHQCFPSILLNCFFLLSYPRRQIIWQQALKNWRRAMAGAQAPARRLTQGSAVKIRQIWKLLCLENAKKHPEN